MAQEHAAIVEAFAAYERSVRDGRYYEAHEDLEAIWYPRRFEDDDEVRLWKGFINAAVSFELIRRKRPEPSRKAWQTYRKYFDRLGLIETPHYPLYVTIAEMLEAVRYELTADKSCKQEEEYVRVFGGDGVSSRV